MKLRRRRYGSVSPRQGARLLERLRDVDPQGYRELRREIEEHLRAIDPDRYEQLRQEGVLEFPEASP